MLKDSPPLPTELGVVPAVDALNQIFARNVPAWDRQTLKLLRSFPRPILVDFNNVLVSQREVPRQANPKAATFLDNLRQVGNVFISTAYWDFELIRHSLKRFSLWRDDLVVMHAHTWKFLSWDDEPKAQGLIREHMEIMQRAGRDYEFDEYFGAFKPMAPLFGKPFDVPIVDDCPGVTEQNPGLLGICVEGFDGEHDPILDDWYPRPPGVPRYTPEEAVSKVQSHYEGLVTNGVV